MPVHLFIMTRVRQARTSERSGNKRATRPGFTILEAIIALAMLAAVFGVCLGLRAQSLAADRRAAAILEAERDIDALFQMAINRTLLDFEPESESGKIIWVGTHLDRPYRIERTVLIQDNPLFGKVPHDAAPQIGVFEYTIEYNGQTTKAMWHR